MVLGSTTVNASPISESEFPYQVWDSAEQKLYISKSTFLYGYVDADYYDYMIINGTKVWITPDNYTHYYLGSYSSYTYILVYTAEAGWSAINANVFSDRYSNIYMVKWNTNDVKNNLYSNHNISGITSLGNIPSNLPQAENLEDILNATTNTTTTAQNLQSNLASSYNCYQSGTVSSDNLQKNINNTVSNLNSLNNNSGNTLADLMAINNGLTYAQTVQDKLNADEINQHLEITTAVKNAITGYINQSNTAYTEYTNGNKTQSETITTLQNQVIYLNQIITNGTAKNSADIEAVNSAINTVQSIINNVSNYSDVDKELSSEYESGEQAEKEFLEDEIAETTSQIQDMSAEQQFSSQQKTESLNILGSIWDLEIFKRLIPICAVFMVVCVAIGVKYRL